MATWYECKCKYNREDQNGFTTITEAYLVDAVSFTDAETRVYQEIGSNYREFVLLSVSKYSLHELVVKEDRHTWYKAKVAITSLDEKSGKEKKLKQTIVVNGHNIKDAYDSIEELFADSVSDYEILDIITTSIIEILPYFEEGERKLVPLEKPAEEVIFKSSESFEMAEENNEQFSARTENVEETELNG
jgi:hypothetical protein